jgi:hypothetical protein
MPLQSRPALKRTQQHLYNKRAITIDCHFSTRGWPEGTSEQHVTSEQQLTQQVHIITLNTTAGQDHVQYINCIGLFQL